jgi:NADPH:quinone reductase-like Zn-dependent oxidoreductase
MTPATASLSSLESHVSHPVMRAIGHETYGGFDSLTMREISRPTPRANEVLIRVRAAALHVGDCFGVQGSPLVMRVSTGLFKPKLGVPGYDVAGVVESVGASTGTCAEYVCASQDRLTHKPAALSFEEASALVTAGLAALHALRDVGSVQAGQRVLINGAAGGIGTMAVQIAKSMGAHVTGVCSTGSMDLVRDLGADEVIDYTTTDFAAGDRPFDLIFDNVENRSLADCRRALADDGTLILNSGTGARGYEFMKRLFKPLLLSPFISQDLRRYMSTPNRKDLAFLAKLAESGQLKPVIDSTCELDEVPAALGKIHAGRAHGRIAVKIS